MPPTPGRPHPVELLLCGHHFRGSQWTLAEAGAAAHLMLGDFAGRAAKLAFL